MGLGDREVLVVPRVGDDRFSLLRARGPGAARQVEAFARGLALEGERLAHLQVDAVGGVELRRFRIGRPRAVQRVEVEARGAAWRSSAGETESPNVTLVLSKVRS